MLDILCNGFLTGAILFMLVSFVCVIVENPMVIVAVISLAIVGTVLNYIVPKIYYKIKGEK